MKVTYIVSLLVLGFAFGKWTEIKELYRVSNYVAVQDLFVDQENGDLHMLFANPFQKYMHYWKMNKDFKLLTNTYFRDESMYFHAANFERGVNSNSLHIVFDCVRKSVDFGVKDQYYSETTDGGKTWTPLLQAPRPNPKDSCSRQGNALLSIRETGDLVWFYHKKCPDTNHQICISKREKGSKDFSLEKVIYESVDYQITNMTMKAEYTIDGNTPLIHLMWFGFKDYDTPLFYLNS